MVLPPPTSLLSSRSSSSSNHMGMNAHGYGHGHGGHGHAAPGAGGELSALSMLASNELYELERAEREREHQLQQQHQYQQHSQHSHSHSSQQSHPSHHQHHSHDQQAQYQPQMQASYHAPPNMSASHGGPIVSGGASTSSAMTPPVPPTCHHEECQRSYRTALRVYQQAQTQSQSQGSAQQAQRSLLASGFHRAGDGTSPQHEEYVSFPGPLTSPRGVGVHPSSPGSTDSSDISRSPPTQVRNHHSQHHQHGYNPYARPSGSGSGAGSGVGGGRSHPSTPRFYTPTASPVLGPMRAGSHHHLPPGALPMPMMISESAVRGGVELDEEDGDMDVDMRESSLSSKVL